MFAEAAAGAAHGAAAESAGKHANETTEIEQETSRAVAPRFAAHANWQATAVGWGAENRHDEESALQVESRTISGELRPLLPQN